MPSVYQLLPSEKYFNYVNGYFGTARPISNDIPVLHVVTLDSDETTQYLKDQNLNSNLIDLAQAFHSSSFDNFDFSLTGISTYNIVGCQTGTIGKIIVKPDGNFQIFEKPGDGTVPIFLRTIFLAPRLLRLRVQSWWSMLTQDGIRQQIITIITEIAADTEGKISPNIGDCHFNGMVVSSHSPVDMHIYDGNGYHVGPTPEVGLTMKFLMSGTMYLTMKLCFSARRGEIYNKIKSNRSRQI